MITVYLAFRYRHYTRQMALAIQHTLEFSPCILSPYHTAESATIIAPCVILGTPTSGGLLVVF